MSEEDKIITNFKGNLIDYIDKLQQENQQLKKSKETAINYIDQVIMYKPCAREIDEELNALIGILKEE